MNQFEETRTTFNKKIAQLQYKPDPKCISKFEEGGITYIKKLIDEDDTGTLGLLLTTHPDVINNRDRWNRTLQHYCIQHNHPQSLEIILHHGADVNAKNVDGLTPLHVAACYNHPQSLEMLLHHGADVHAKDNKGHTLLSLALNEECKKVLKLFRK